MATPVVKSTNGFGTPVTVVASGGLPVDIATNGFGAPIIEVASGGIPVTYAQGGGGQPSLLPYTFEAETDAFATAAGLTGRPKRSYNRLIKRLKAAGIWAKASCMLALANGVDEATSLRWLNDPTKTATKISTPGFNASFGWTATANGQAINTGLNASTLSQNDVGAYVYCTSAPTGSSNSDMGAIDGSSNGINICARRATNDNMTLRLAGSAVTTISADNDTFGDGLSGGSRSDSANITGSHNGVAKNTVANASVALPNLNIYLLAHNANGAVSNFSTRRQAFCYIGRALTNAQETELTAAVGEFVEAAGYGHAYIEEVGVGTQSITADFIAYGFTPISVLSCLQAARNGLSVALVGGWRDRFNFGGMSSGGLGFADVLNTNAFGGLVRYLTKRIQTIASNPTENYYFEPRQMQWALRELLTPEKNGGYSIPIYQTNGVLTCQKTGTNVTSFTTVDGRTFNIKGGVDPSYEGDLLRAAGVTVNIGREAAGTGAEASNGVRAAFNEYVGVDPCKTPGDPNSGFINMINAVRSTFTPGLNTLPAAGTSDQKTQAYNFRLTMTNSARWRRPCSSTPPAGFDIADYEILLRFIAANPSLVSFTDYFKADAFATVSGESKFDVNNRAGPPAPSTDFIGKNWDYPLASRSVREAIWKANWNWEMGMLWVLQYSTDPRIPSALQTACRNWGFCSDHYFSPHENDTVGMNPQLYVREAVRLDGVAKLLGTELTRGDGGVPSISTNTISMISYFMDSHSVNYIAYEKTAGTWIVAGEGGMEVDLGGTDGMFPLPLEIATPKAAECTNLFAAFCFSASHVAFGATRMEYTAMQAGQSLGQVAAEAIKNNRTFQDAANYPAARTALLANAFALTNEPVPVLAQTT